MRDKDQVTKSPYKSCIMVAQPHESERVREKQDKRDEAVHVCHVREKCCTVKKEMKFVTDADILADFLYS